MRRMPKRLRGEGIVLSRTVCPIGRPAPRPPAGASSDPSSPAPQIVRDPKIPSQRVPLRLLGRTPMTPSRPGSAASCERVPAKPYYVGLISQLVNRGPR